MSDTDMDGLRGAAASILAARTENEAALRRLCAMDGHIYDYSHTANGVDVLVCTTCEHTIRDAKITWYDVSSPGPASRPGSGAA